MKKLLLSFFFALLCQCMMAQDEQTPLEPLSFSEVVKVDSASKKDLAQSTKRWIASLFKNPDAVTKYDGDDEIFVSSNYDYNPHAFVTTAMRGYVTFEVRVMFREGRMKVTMTDFYHKTTNRHASDLGLVYNREVTKQEWKDIKVGGLITKQVYNKTMEEVRKEAAEEWSLIIGTIKDNIKDIKAQKEEDDW